VPSLAKHYLTGPRQRCPIPAALTSPCRPAMLASWCHLFRTGAICSWQALPLVHRQHCTLCRQCMSVDLLALRTLGRLPLYGGFSCFSSCHQRCWLTVGSGSALPICDGRYR
jgi:hypothetical protein